MRLRHPRQTPVLTRTEGSFSYQGVSKGGGLGTRQILNIGHACIFIVHDGDCNGSPYGFNCRVSCGAPRNGQILL